MKIRKRKEPRLDPWETLEVGHHRNAQTGYVITDSYLIAGINEVWLTR